MKKTVMKITSSFCLAIFTFTVPASICNADDIIVIEDFESESYGQWRAEGDAFGKGPREEDMVGALGSRAAASTGRSGVGTLTSPAFTIERNAIYLLLGAVEIDGPAQEVAVELLVDGDVVRTVKPNRYHAMFWYSWDVTDFKGKKGLIRIVDKDTRRRAFIFIDHIIQSDVPAERPLLERTITITKPILNFPLKTRAARHYIELVVDGKQVRAMDVELATDEIDYWVVTDLTPWLGKKLLMRTHQHPLGNANILDRISVEDGIRDSDNLYREALRPQFHFSSKRGWINDDNGLVYYDGEYHLYYQHNPYGWDHSRNDYNKTWGHAVSTDLVHWTELAGVIHPDHLGTIYSGSAVVDERNTTGFQTGKEKPIVAVYTSAGGRSPWSQGKAFSQSIAYSNDRGRTFTKYEGNPVLPNIEYINRDPKAIWYEPASQWVIVLHFDGRAMAFFTSDDLKKWEYQSEFESRYLVDCPELFQLAVDGDEDNKKWIIYGGPGAYYVGDFDGKKYTPETEITRYSRGNCFYASQTFNNVPKEDGRRIQIAWGVIPMEGMPFNQQMLFPVELTLHTTDEGLRMFAYPVEEIERIYGKEHAWTDVQLKPGQNILSNVGGELFDIEAELEIGDADEFGFLINGFSVKYNVDKNQLSCGRPKAELKPIDGKIRLRILVDRVSIEIFANDGRIYMPIRAIPEGEERGLEVFTKGGNIKIISLKIHELKSIWN
ncbi:MAG: GH32 C-terminal domain-containing protein [Planctomycetota bacterium]